MALHAGSAAGAGDMDDWRSAPPRGDVADHQRSLALRSGDGTVDVHTDVVEINISLQTGAEEIFFL